ncbi:MAG: UDP-N-acetylmuramate--L-alanine ligase [Candidatus Cyclobacteriaceae bacterium M2_1C_046]
MSHIPKKIHLISVGGSVMHNIAIALKQQGHYVTGSDDEVYEPSKSRLEKHGLLPSTQGWDANRITPDLDLIILGMHAREDNPELLKAKELGIPIMSFPDYIYQHSTDKQRIVIAGSHGKTTITAMILHVLHHFNRKFDYLVGASVAGIENSVKLTDDAPVIVIEGDEYLTSPIDLVPKFLKYNHHIGVISGISWDHMNVFPSEEDYVRQFDLFADSTPKGGTLIYNADDAMAAVVGNKEREDVVGIPYKTPKYKLEDGVLYLTEYDKKVPLKVFGEHNLQNIEAARQVVKKIGITDEQFNEAISTFTGAGKRLEKVAEANGFALYSDYAHAPSKVKATVKAMKQRYPDRKLVACFELHTFSSLNKEFLPNYKNVMKHADEALVYYNPENLAKKRLEYISPEDVVNEFDKKGLMVFTDKQELMDYISGRDWQNSNLLLMSSGTFDKLDIKQLATQLTTS